MQLASHGSCRNTPSIQQRPLWGSDRCAPGAVRTPQSTSLTAIQSQQHSHTWPPQLCPRQFRQAVECAAASGRRDASGAASQPEQRRSPPRSAPAVLPNYPFTLHQLVIFSVSSVCNLNTLAAETVRLLCSKRPAAEADPVQLSSGSGVCQVAGSRRGAAKLQQAEHPRADGKSGV